MTKPNSKTVPKQLKPFKKNDPRINRNGRPPIPKDEKDLDARIARILARQVNVPVGTDADGKTKYESMPLIDNVLLRLAGNKSPLGQIHILDRYYGKLTDKHNLVITSDQAMDLIYAVLGIIQANVTDEKQLSAISEDIRKLVKNPAQVKDGSS